MPEIFIVIVVDLKPAGLLAAKLAAVPDKVKYLETAYLPLRGLKVQGVLCRERHNLYSLLYYLAETMSRTGKTGTSSIVEGREVERYSITASTRETYDPPY